MVKRLKLESILVNHICIEMPDKDNVMSNQILLGETIALRGWKMVVDLIIFYMPNFDMILGMDLSWYGAEIDYKKKKVHFHLDDSENLTSSEEYWV